MLLLVNLHDSGFFIFSVCLVQMETLEFSVNSPPLTSLLAIQMDYFIGSFPL